MIERFFLIYLFFKDMLVLLDLLGTPHPAFYNFFENTQKWYREMIMCEERLASEGYLESYFTSSISIKASPTRYFQPHSVFQQVEDDHIPFLRRGVPILHLIPIPFPDVWHKKIDNRDAVDLVTVENLMKIFRIFLIEYLNIEV